MYLRTFLLCSMILILSGIQSSGSQSQSQDYTSKRVWECEVSGLLTEPISCNKRPSSIADLTLFAKSIPRTYIPPKHVVATYFIHYYFDKAFNKCFKLWEEGKFTKRCEKYLDEAKYFLKTIHFDQEKYLHIMIENYREFSNEYPKRCADYSPPARKQFYEGKCDVILRTLKNRIGQDSVQ